MQMTAEEFNSKYPVGTKVIYHPIIGEQAGTETKTRSEAWELGHGEAVVKVSGKPGGVSLRAITVVISTACCERCDKNAEYVVWPEGWMQTGVSRHGTKYEPDGIAWWCPPCAAIKEDLLAQEAEASQPRA
jgi:hypothetical protein